MRSQLDTTKTDEDKLFYSGRKWTETSLHHRVIEPLCRRCKSRGLTVEGKMTHHYPSRKELIRRGLNPYDDKYLETLCDNCHLEDLRDMREKY